MNIHHLAFKVSSLDEIIDQYSLLGAVLESRRVYDEVMIEMVVLLLGGVRLEFMKPTHEKSPIYQAMDGFHHMAFAIDELHDSYFKFMNEPSIQLVRHLAKGAFGHDCFFFNFKACPTFSIELLGK